MRIAFCTESFPPTISGVAVFISRSAEELVKRGHEVLILAPSTTGKPGKEQYHGAQVQRLRSVPNPFKKGTRLVVGQQLGVSAALRRFRPDVIHIHDVGGASQAGLRWGKLHRVPVVGTRHFSARLVAAYLPLGRMFEDIGLIDAYSNEFFSQCNLITCPTETVKQGMLATKRVTAPLEVLSNGVDIPDLPNLQARRDEPVPIVLVVSRIDEDKNLDLVLEAAPRVFKKHPVQFVIVGSGTMLEEYREQVHTQGLAEFVTFVGSVKPNSKELKQWFERATLMAVPSLVETQSISTLEAMAMALPVVAVRAGALPEIVIPKRTGYLVPVPTAEHFAATILSALKDRRGSEKLGLGGRELVEREHAREKCVEKLESLYSKLII